MVGRIEICGGIACGKSTLAGCFEERGLTVYRENFQASPFLEPFYQNTQRYAFENEAFFMIDYLHQAKLAEDSVQLADFDQGYHFHRSYGDILHLQGACRKAYEDLCEHILAQISKPDLIVYLHCPVEEQLRRIAHRGREMEEAIDADYLKALDGALRALLKDTNVPIVEINTRKVNFVSDLFHASETVDKILDAVAQ